MTGFDWTIDVGPQTSTVVTTQACEKLYRSSGGVADVRVNLKIGDQASLAWLPQKTILFDQSALHRSIDIDCAPSAKLLLVEPMVFGRQAMGESVHEALLRDRWRIRRNGRLLHAEDASFTGSISEKLQRTAVMGGNIAMATLLAVHEDVADWVEPLREGLGAESGVSAITSSAGNRLVMRMTAPSSFELRKILVPAIDYCNRKIMGPDHGLPKLWTI